MRTQVAPAAPAVARAEVPALVVANFFLVEATVDGAGPFRFLIDTGSTVSLVSAEVAGFGTPDAAGSEPVRVRSSRGDEVLLPGVSVNELGIGAAKFMHVRAARYDFEDLSDQLGFKVDGLLGLAVFRDVLLTLDYPARRLKIAPLGEWHASDADLLALTLNERGPTIQLRLGDDSVAALVDSGSDAALSLNRGAAPVDFVGGLRRGTLNATISGDYPQVIGRLAGDVNLGGHTVSRPIVEITDGATAIGGEILSHFALTFDQQRGLLALQRGSSAPIEVASRRSTGVVFDRNSDHWAVAAIIPATPAETLPIATGDVCIGVNGEPIGQWPIERFQELLRQTGAVTLTLAANSLRPERVVEVPVVALVQ